MGRKFIGRYYSHKRRLAVEEQTFFVSRVGGTKIHSPTSWPLSSGLILKNISRSPMYSGDIDSSGPRYCPSIEDKVYKFSHNPSHILQLEPEWSNSKQIYVNGFSTSLPEDIQLKCLMWCNFFLH